MCTASKLLTTSHLKKKKSHDTAVGPDKIPYQFLKNLPHLLLKKMLLRIFNFIWISGKIPCFWHEAEIIIPKPGKDHNDPINYYPIALTSCLCKTIERIVNDCLVWILESEHHISNAQCGFRKGQSTTDHFVFSYIRDACIRKEHVVADFFDLERAYGMTWKLGILKDLYQINFEGCLPNFFERFLLNRLFRVKVANTLNDTKITLFCKFIYMLSWTLQE